MAKIFISYSKLDYGIVSDYVENLRKYGHEILMDDSLLVVGDTIQNVLMDAMKEADGTIIFLTDNSGKSSNVNSEIGIARTFFDSNNKFLIPLVSGGAFIPYVISSLVYIQIDNRPAAEIVIRINEAIARHELNKAATKTVSIHFTPFLFSTDFYNFMLGLAPDASIDEWTFDGLTRIAYPTPNGKWDSNGFIFYTNEYSFIVRSIPREDSSYLVVESNNLEGQLANIALNNSGKFQNKNGIVTITETFDMTVGLGRRSRDEVRAAFQKAGMDGNIITSFNEREYHWTNILLDILRWSVFREKAKLILLEPAEDGVEIYDNTIAAQQFWLLKIYGENWHLDKMRVGENCYFNSYLNPSEKRPEYDLFASVKIGDKGIAYDFWSGHGIIFLFEITEAIHINENLGEIISFKLTLILRQAPVKLSQFAEYIDFSDQLNGETPQKLFTLTSKEYQAINAVVIINSTTDVYGISFNTPKISHIFADSATKDIKDELGFESDINALASVIAYRQVTPPLAIGLFGNWGSGKSFFMNKLQQKIENLSQDKSGTFCRKVLQINFNSWHYSDSNLWASLITKIFEDLQRYGANQQSELNNLLQKLSSTKEFLHETKMEKAAIDKSIEILEAQKQILDNTVKEQSENLNSLDVNEILKGILEDTDVKSDINKLRNDFSFIHTEEVDQIDADIDKLQGFFDKLFEAIKITKPLFQGKNTIYTLVFTAFIGFGIFELCSNIQYFKTNFITIQSYFIMIAGGLGFILKFLQPAFAVVNNGLKRLQSLSITINKLKEKAKNKFLTEQERMDKKLFEVKVESDDVSKKIDLLKIEQEKLEDSIQSIASGKRIIKFIESKVADEKYTNSLGIISWIRRDFEQLNLLLYQQVDAKEKIADKISNSINNFELERIILYIDDLDRCDKDIVVKVLEAIHLLLAFPLFVVIVGVDPRWMNNALEGRYAELLKGKISNDTRQLPDKSRQNDATSYDYLEKIFQIPFALKPMSQEGKVHLIKSQLQDTVAPIQKIVVEGAEEQKVIVDMVDSVHVGEHDESEDLKNDDVEKVDDISKRVNKPGLERLLISNTEIEFISKIAFLIGDSPRTIKRYVNIYRIIRTHTDLKLEIHDYDSFYFASLLMLAIVTGQPSVANKFCELLTIASEAETFLDFLTQNKYMLVEANAGMEELYDLINSTTKTSLSLLGKITMSKFKENIELVSRFSFRNIG